MAEEHKALGRYLRNRRKELGLTLADVKKATKYSLGYLSRLELGQVTDGPSLKCLEELAKGLQVDLLVLTRLKEGASQAVSNGRGADTGEGLTDLEREMVAGLRGLEERGQRFLIEETRLCRAFWGRGHQRLQPGLPQEVDKILARASADEPSIAGIYRRLAEDYRELGDRLMDFLRPTEALSAYRSAATFLGALEAPISRALLSFFMGRALLALEADSPQSVMERQRCLEEAADCFAQAHAGLGVEAALPDSERERRPEILAQWAFALVRQADLVSPREEFRDLPAEVRESIRRGYLDRAAARRREGLDLYREWIAVLEQRVGNVERDRLLVEAHHRLAVLHRDAAGDARSAEERQDHFTEIESQFYRALELRRRLACAAADEAARTHALNRLANTHQELGRSIHQFDAERDRYAKAAWQYAVAERLNALYDPAYDPAQTRYLEGLALALEEDVGETTRIAVNRRVKDLLERWDVAGLEYPFTFEEANGAPR